MTEKEVIASFQREAPVDITAMANGLGLSVYEDFDLPVGVSGKIAQDLSGESPNGFVISVKANEPFNRQRFTIAHECAHYLLHRGKIGDGVLDDAMYRSKKMNSQEEFDANNKAADLLMPRHLVVSVRRETTNVAELAKLFQVSDAAMRVRLSYLDRFETPTM